MIQDLTTNELISGIANGNYGKIEIIKYCSSLSDIKDFWDVLIVEQSKMIGMSNAPIVSFSPDAVLDDTDTISTANEIKIDRLARAISIVEDLMQGNQEKAASDEQSEIPKATDESIYKMLFDLYDILWHDDVIDGLEKKDFVYKILIGEVAPINAKHSGWVKKTAKFKAFVKVIRPFFNDAWYLAVCRNAGLAKDQMSRYDCQGDSTRVFEKDLKKIIQKKS